MSERYVNIQEIKDLKKQIREIQEKIRAYPKDHCRVCGDTQPRNGWYPIFGGPIGGPSESTSFLLCNRCGRSDENYEQTFGEPKEKIINFL